MVVRAEVCVAEIACGFRECEQIIERAMLAGNRDQRKVHTEFHGGLCLPERRHQREIEPTVEQSGRLLVNEARLDLDVGPPSAKLHEHWR
jgi:hypothetical protein